MKKYLEDFGIDNCPNCEHELEYDALCPKCGKNLEVKLRSFDKFTEKDIDIFCETLKNFDTQQNAYMIIEIYNKMIEWQEIEYEFQNGQCEADDYVADGILDFIERQIVSRISRRNKRERDNDAQ